MSAFDDYADRFLAALYLETVDSGADFHSARSIHEKYGLVPEKLWVSRMADEWEYRYFKDVSKVLGSYDGWSFRLSPEGYRKVEEDFRDSDEVREFLGRGKAASIQSLSAKLVPAADRTVSIGDNSGLKANLAAGLDEISEQLSASNELDPDEKSDVIFSLELAKKLISGARSFLVGAFKYLVVDRLKKAFEKTIEDVFRVAIIATLSTLVGLLILAV